jgi:hypothetical protein
MVMSFIDGTPLMQLRDKVAHLPKWQRDKVSYWIAQGGGGPVSKGRTSGPAVQQRGQDRQSVE